MIETPKFMENETGYFNLCYLASIRNIINKDTIKENIKLFDLDNVKNKKVKTYSLGMKQRLGLAMAILSRPRLMVLDEPLNGLDIEGVIRIRELIEQMSKQNGAACLISGHVAAELEKVCSHVAVLHEGKIAAFDTLENALKYRPSLEEYYISVVRGCGGGVSL